MCKVLKCEEVELIKVPSLMVDIIYSRYDGGSRGVKYRYIKWLESLSQVDYGNSVMNGFVQQAKIIHDRIIKDLIKADDATFSVIEIEEELEE